MAHGAERVEFQLRTCRSLDELEGEEENIDAQKKKKKKTGSFFPVFFLLQK